MLFLDAELGASRGDAVIKLLERARVPPVPPFYKLCYDYLAGVRTLDTIRAGSIIAASPTGTSATARLYEEFVAPYETHESVGVLVERMLERIAVLETLVVASQEATRTQAAELAGAAEHLDGGNIDEALLRDWIGRLLATNDALRRANATLNDEFEQSLEVFTTAQDEMAALRRGASIDPLTGIANRAGIDQVLPAILDEASEGGRRVALGVVDIDNFKTLNDTYGHQIGDEILKMVGRALTASAREADVVGRLGGDEFLVVIRDEDLPGARLLAERVRRAIVDCDLSKVLGKGILGNMTASIGVAGFRPGDSVATLFERADRCLLEAKQRGRNQTVVETSPRQAA
ncbi:MAG TPA: GGDEF domain-containing protein [Devosia sp.]